MHRLALIRHGQSVWNQENRFTGWTDVDLSPAGVEEARNAARLLRSAGFDFDLCYVSLLKRAVKTLNIILDEMDLLWLPVVKTWRLNERFYGALQGLNKAETAALHGAEQVRIWRRSYDVRPPAITREDERFPGNDRRYSDMDPHDLPLSESLKDAIARTLPCWFEDIAPKILAGKRILISAHGNSLRGLVKYLEDMGDEDISAFEIPTGRPLIYELSPNLKPVDRYYLGEKEHQ